MKSCSARVALSALLSAVFVSSAFVANAFAAEIALVNPGFEAPRQGDAIPGWIELQHAGVDAYEMTIDDKVFHGGKHSFRMHRRVPQVYGLLEQNVAVTDLVGKQIELSAQLRTLNVGPAGWQLSMNFMTAGGEIISSAKAPALGGTSKKWQAVTLHAVVPPRTASISIDLLLTEKGTAWADDLRLRTLEP